MSLGRRSLTRLADLPKAEKDALLERVDSILAAGTTTEALEEVLEIFRLASLPHGTRSAYVRGCRCELCAGANADYHREYYRQTTRK